MINEKDKDRLNEFSEQILELFNNRAECKMTEEKLKQVFKDKLLVAYVLGQWRD